MGTPRQDVSDVISQAIERIRVATYNTPFEGRLYLVGGMLRDRALGLPLSGDLDLVTEGDALALARLLYESGLSRHFQCSIPGSAPQCSHWTRATPASRLSW